jgi:hypothetical protein
MEKKLMLLTLALLTGCGQTPMSVSVHSTAPTGPAGPQGERGEQGPRGLDGSSPEAVPFCPDVPGVEGAFQEYGLRIGGKLYAVYAQGQRIFLTELSAGTYVTTDGRACIFSVNEEGQVQL